jgi:hypothetical protein
MPPEIRLMVFETLINDLFGIRHPEKIQRMFFFDRSHNVLRADQDELYQYVGRGRRFPEKLHDRLAFLRTCKNIHEVSDVLKALPVCFDAFQGHGHRKDPDANAAVAI